MGPRGARRAATPARGRGCRRTDPPATAARAGPQRLPAGRAAGARPAVRCRCPCFVGITGCARRGARGAGTTGSARAGAPAAPRSTDAVPSSISRHKLTKSVAPKLQGSPSVVPEGTRTRSRTWTRGCVSAQGTEAQTIPSWHSALHCSVASLCS